MKNIMIFVFLVVSVSLWSESTEQQGVQIIEKSDRRFFPGEGTFDVEIGEIEQGIDEKSYTMQFYKKGKQLQTVVWVSPDVMKNNVSMRSGDVIYYKPLKAIKPDIISFQAIFMESSFSWGDLLESDLRDNYKAIEIREEKQNGADCYFLQLAPLKEDRYARIDVWVEKGTFTCKRRTFYTASGDILRDAVYTVLREEGGKVLEFRVEMEDFFMETKSFAIFTRIKSEKLPQFFFDVQSIGRIHMR